MFIIAKSYSGRFQTIGLAKKFVRIFVRCYRKTRTNFLANPIYCMDLKFITINSLKNQPPPSFIKPYCSKLLNSLAWKEKRQMVNWNQVFLLNVS